MLELRTGTDLELVGIGKEEGERVREGGEVQKERRYEKREKVSERERQKSHH